MTRGRHAYVPAPHSEIEITLAAIRAGSQLLLEFTGRTQATSRPERRTAILAVAPIVVVSEAAVAFEDVATR